MSFESDINKFVNKVERKASLVFRKSAIEMFTRIIMHTPVDTGRARGNWQCTLETPAEGATSNADKIGVATVAAMTARTDAAEKSVYLTNNLPYINLLEHGSSKQAPAGMVRVATEDFSHIVAENLRE